VRAAIDQIADRDQPILVREVELGHELLELAPAAVDVTYENVASHDLARS
jgi:hypothetical protein